MQAEERLPKDYEALRLLTMLSYLQQQNDQDTFAAVLCKVWMELAAPLPRTVGVIAIDAYFKRHGDIAAALREHGEQVAKVVGYLPHQEAMRRIRADVATLDQLLKVL